MIPADKKIERMVTAAHLYYELGLSQQEVAKKLGISRPLVSILLTEAKSCGIVTITINDVESAEQLLAQRLESSFSLQSVLVIGDRPSATETDDAVAAAAYELCFTGEQRGRRVGIGWGSTLGRIADYAETLPDSSEHEGWLFPLVGGIGASYRGYHSNEIARIISGKAGLEADYLYFPAFFDSESELELVRHMDSFRAMNDKWDQMELALIGISNYPSYPDLGVEYRFGSELTKQRAVGRVLAHYYDLDGRVITPLVDNVVQASVEQLRNTKTVVAVCSALLRPESVIGALSMNIAHRLVLPRSLAEKVLDARG